MENKKEKSTFGFKRLWVVALLPLAFVITALASTSEDFRAIYGEKIYPFMSGTLNFLFSQTRTSVAEIVLIAFAALLAASVIGTILKLLFGRRKGRAFVSFIVNLLCVASAVYFLFTVTCGINYYRDSFAEIEHLDTSESTESELVALAESLVSRLNEADASFDRNYQSFDDTSDRAVTYFATLAEMYPSLQGEYGAPKAVNFFGMMSYSQITGFFFPFTYEANVNDSIPKMSLPATMCHELVHLRGFMREDEANYIAYLACVESGDPEFVYSGLLLAYSYTANALYSQNPQSYITVSSELNDNVKADLHERQNYWEKYEGIVAEVSDKVNDTYLKVNAQSDGTKSYGRMVDLLIAEMRKG